MEPIITSKQYNVHFYEVDYKERLLPTVLMSYFSDVAIYQSKSRGVGLDYLSQNNMCWVLYKWNINIIKYPKLDDKITVTTIPYALKKFYAYRKFEVFNEAGEKIATADSVWFLINTKKRRPMRIKEDLYKAYGLTSDCEVCKDNICLNKLEREDFKRSFDIRYSEIDTNRHANNVYYLSWSIETLPLEIVNTYNLANVKVIYEKEVKYGNHIEIKTQMDKIDDKVNCITNVVGLDGERKAIIETVWVKAQ